MKSVISKLKKLFNKDGSRDKIDLLEDAIAESIDEAVAEEGFYSLPTNEILTILGKSDIESVGLLCDIVSKMSEKKEKESPLLLNVIDPKDATFDECIRIISKFIQCPLCKRIGQMHEDDKSLPDRDYEHELEELKKENERLKKPATKMVFTPVTEKPEDFESDICKAAEEGKLSSVQYLVEQCHANVEAKDEDGNTPIIWASEKGHLEVVKYLHEECHANAEAKDKNGYTPIICASWSGRLEVVKYLHEECHAKITDEAISKAKNDEVRRYLQSKR